MLNWLWDACSPTTVKPQFTVRVNTDPCRRYCVFVERSSRWSDIEAMDAQFDQIVMKVRHSMGPDCPLGVCSTTDYELKKRIAQYGLTGNLKHTNAVLEAFKTVAPSVLVPVNGCMPSLVYE